MRSSLSVLCQKHSNDSFLFVNQSHFVLKYQSVYMKLPYPIQKVADELAELPSIGPRQAIRIAFYLAAQNKDAVRSLAVAVDNLRNIKLCERCFFIHQNE